MPNPGYIPIPIPGYMKPPPRNPPSIPPAKNPLLKPPRPPRKPPRKPRYRRCCASVSVTYVDKSSATMRAMMSVDFISILVSVKKIDQCARLKGEPSSGYFYFNPYKPSVLFIGHSTLLLQSLANFIGERSVSVVECLTRDQRFEPHRRHCAVVLEQDTFILA